MGFRAVIFDLGGVVFPSPFEAFARYERGAQLPEGSVRALVRDSSERGAWAALERGELTLAEFAAALEAEGASRGLRIDAHELMQQVASGFGPHPEMVGAIESIRERGLLTAALTNNWHDSAGTTPRGLDSVTLFDVVVESAREGMRKPDPRIYSLVLERLSVEPHETVFLDDLGPNLKPARAMGITTIKVAAVDEALAELEAVLGFVLSERG